MPIELSASVGSVEAPAEGTSRRPWSKPFVISSVRVKASEQFSAIASDDGSPIYTHS